MRIFSNLCFHNCGPPLWSLVTYLSQDTFSEDAHDPLGLAWNVSESGSVAADQLKAEHQHQNRGMGFTKARALTLPWISWRRRVYSTHDMKNRSTEQQTCYRIIGKKNVPSETNMYTKRSSPKTSDYCHRCNDLELCSWSRRGSWDPI